MPDIDLREQYKIKLASARTLLSKNAKKMTTEIEEKINGILGEADVIRAQIELDKKIRDGERFTDEPVVTDAVYRQAGKTEGVNDIDPKAWRSLDFTSVWGEKKNLRYFVPLGTEGNAYKDAFEGYLRKGRFADLGPRDKKALSEGVDSAGGFLVPEDYYKQVLSEIAQFAHVRANATIISTGSNVINFPSVKKGSGEYTSRIEHHWVDETPTASDHETTSTDVFTNLKAEIHTGMTSMLMSNNLIEDSAFDIMGFFSQKAAEAMTLGGDNANINGTGVGQPKGLLYDVDGVGPVSVNTGAASALKGDGLVKLFYELKGHYATKAKWLMASSTMLEIELLKDVNNRYLISSLMNSSLASPVMSVLKGKPVLRDDYVPEVAAGAYPIIFGDLSGYYILDRVGFSVQVVKEKYAEQNQTQFLARRREGGILAEPWKIKVQKVSA